MASLVPVSYSNDVIRSMGNSAHSSTISGTYDRNSYAIPPPTVAIDVIEYLGMVQCVLILAHSAYLHGFNFKWRKWRKNSIRTISDLTALAAFGCLFFSTLHEAKHHMSGGLTTAIGTIFLAATYWLDSYVFYNRYLACKPNMSCSAKAWMYTFLYLQFVFWMTAALIGPFFVNLNSSGPKQIYSMILTFEAILKILFNLFYTVLFLQMINRLLAEAKSGQLTDAHLKVFWIAVKSVIHFITSLIALVLSASLAKQGLWKITLLIMPNQIHFLFNYEIEKNCIVVAIFNMFTACFGSCASVTGRVVPADPNHFDQLEEQPLQQPPPPVLNDIEQQIGLTLMPAAALNEAAATAPTAATHPALQMVVFNNSIFTTNEIQPWSPVTADSNNGQGGSLMVGNSADGTT